MAMRKRLGFIVGILLAAATTPAFAAQPTEQQVRQLMDVIGLGRSLSQMNSQIAVSMKQALPCVSPNYWQGYIDDNASKEFIGRLVPVYQKHFSAEEVDGMVKFYSSPLGQKVLNEMPPAMAEANQAGQQWSHDHTQQMITKLEQAGTLGSNGRCPATSFAGAPASSGSAAPAEDASDEAADTAAVPAVAHGASGSSRRHGHVAAKKHGSTGTSGKKKAATGKKTTTKTSTKKGDSAKSATPAKAASTHHPSSHKPAAATKKTTPAG